MLKGYANGTRQCEQQIDKLISTTTHYPTGDYIVSVITTSLSVCLCACKQVQCVCICMCTAVCLSECHDMINTSSTLSVVYTVVHFQALFNSINQYIVFYMLHEDLSSVTVSILQL